MRWLHCSSCCPSAFVSYCTPPDVRATRNVKDSRTTLVMDKHPTQELLYGPFQSPFEGSASGGLTRHIDVAPILVYYPEGSSTQYLKSLVPNIIKGMVCGGPESLNIGTWTLLYLIYHYIIYHTILLGSHIGHLDPLG